MMDAVHRYEGYVAQALGDGIFALLCLKGWEIALHSSLTEIEKGLASGSDDWQRRVALGGYAGEGVQMSIKQMSAQLLSVDLTEQGGA